MRDFDDLAKAHIGLTNRTEQAQRELAALLRSVALEEAELAHENVRYAANVTGCKWCNRISELLRQV